MLDQHDLQKISEIVTTVLAASEGRTDARFVSMEAEMDTKLLSMEERISHRMDGKFVTFEERIVSGVASLLEDAVLPQIDELRSDIKSVRYDLTVLHGDMNARFGTLCGILENKHVFTPTDSQTVRQA